MGSSKVDMTAGVLSFGACHELAPKIRREDLVECMANDHTALEALAVGAQDPDGAAWSVWSLRGPRKPKEIVGAFGWSGQGSIWCLWSELSTAEARFVLQNTRKWVKMLVRQSGREYLENAVWSGNTKAIGWLQASKCFNIDMRPVDIKGLDFYRFRTRSDLIQDV